MKLDSVAVAHKYRHDSIMRLRGVLKLFRTPTEERSGYSLYVSISHASTTIPDRADLRTDDTCLWDKVRKTVKVNLRAN